MGRPPPLRLLLILAALLPPPGARRAREMGLEGGIEGGVWGWGSPSRDEVGKGGDGAGLSAPPRLPPAAPGGPPCAATRQAACGAGCGPVPWLCDGERQCPNGTDEMCGESGWCFGGVWGAHPALGSPSGHGDASWSLLLGC